MADDEYLTTNQGLRMADDDNSARWSVEVANVVCRGGGLDYNTHTSWAAFRKGPSELTRLVDAPTGGHKFTLLSLDRQASSLAGEGSTSVHSLSTSYD